MAIGDIREWTCHTYDHGATVLGAEAGFPVVDTNNAVFLEEWTDPNGAVLKPRMETKFELLAD